MAKCKNCRNLTSVEEYGEKYPWCDMLDDCPNIEFERDCPKFEKMSNADAIRAMSDEELAECFATLVICEICEYCGENKCNRTGGEFLCTTATSAKMLCKWLKSEVKE